MTKEKMRCRQCGRNTGDLEKHLRRNPICRDCEIAERVWEQQERLREIKEIKERGL